MAATSGMNHLGLSVRDLNETTRLFIDCLGWEKSGRDKVYPRTAVSDGVVRLTLWQVTEAAHSAPFDRRNNVGLHHVAIAVASKSELLSLANWVQSHPGVEIEFMPELVGDGPRMHMICAEPGGLRVEFIWSGQLALVSCFA